LVQILKRARGPNDGDITSFRDAPNRNEINRRTWKAGYTDRDGQPKDLPKIRIFGGTGETKLNIWPRDERGNLIDD
jgi:hypothetical protein